MVRVKRRYVLVELAFDRDVVSAGRSTANKVIVTDVQEAIKQSIRANFGEYGL